MKKFVKVSIGTYNILGWIENDPKDGFIIVKQAVLIRPHPTPGHINLQSLCNDKSVASEDIFIGTGSAVIFEVSTESLLYQAYQQDRSPLTLPKKKPIKLAH